MFATKNSPNYIDFPKNLCYAISIFEFLSNTGGIGWTTPLTFAHLAIYNTTLFSPLQQKISLNYIDFTKILCYAIFRKIKEIGDERVYRQRA